MGTHVISIRGMHCAACTQRVQAALQTVQRVESVNVDLLSGKAYVQSLEPIDLDAAVAAVERCGYEANAETAKSAGVFRSRESNEADDEHWLRRLMASGVLLAIILVRYFWPDAMHHHETPLKLIWLAFSLYVGWPYFRRAASGLIHGEANMDSLITLGVSAALIAGYLPGEAAGHGMDWLDGGLILVFVTFGKWLESRSRAAAQTAARGLAELAAPVAIVQRRGNWVEAAAVDVAVDELILIRPGAGVPLDSVIVEGNSDLDESWLTGESLPIAKGTGSPIFAGTINRGAGALTARVTHVAGETLLAKIHVLLQSARASKMNVQRLADRIVATFVPTVLLIALGTCLGWGWFAGDWQRGVRGLVAVLVVACPCALGLATPVAVAVAMGVAGRRGILVKQAQAIETAAAVDVVVFDKTGTLTVGQPELVSITPANGASEAELLTNAASLEQMSPHPLAKSVVKLAQERGLTLSPATDFKIMPGLGVRGSVADHAVAVGTKGILSEHGFDESMGDNEKKARLSEEGLLRIFVTRDGQLLGTLAFQDRVLPESRAALASLKRMGLRCELVTGDKKTVADKVAAELDIDRVLSETRPQQKLEHIRSLMSNGERVMMVGDGINDAPALATASIGVAVGTGADIARDSAQMIVLGNNRSAIAEIITLSRCTARKIRQNFYCALGFNVIMIPLATGIFASRFGVSLPPVFAALMMSISSIVVVLNSSLILFALPRSRGDYKGQK